MAQHFRLGCALLACLAAALAVLLVSSPRGAEASPRLDRAERGVIRHVNRFRTRNGLPQVRPDHRLARSAESHSRDMLGANFFAHFSSNGESMVQRVGSFRPARLLGEVLASVPAGAGRLQSRQVVAMWRRSPAHRASLLSASFKRIGVARRTGTLGGRRVTVFTADFASRR